MKLAQAVSQIRNDCRPVFKQRTGLDLHVEYQYSLSEGKQAVYFRAGRRDQAVAERVVMLDNNLAMLSLRQCTELGAAIEALASEVELTGDKAFWHACTGTEIPEHWQ